MTNTLRTALNSDFTLCQQLWHNWQLSKGYEINWWIERNSDKQHFELDEILDKTKDEIEQRLEIRFAPKFLAGAHALEKINKKTIIKKEV